MGDSSAFEDDFEVSTSLTGEEHGVWKYLQTQQICTCNPLDLTMMTNHLCTRGIQKLIYEFYFKLFQSFKFKQALGISFAANFDDLVFLNPSDGNRLATIGVQILTIDDIALKIIKEPQLKKNFIDVYAKSIDLMVEKKFEDISIG